jgi:DNA polymerase-3 subunit delta
VKLSAARFTQLLRGSAGAATPPPLLIYGGDRGLVRERAAAWAAAVVGDARDPFRCVELTAAAVRADPGLLLAEACALGLVAGPRLVWLRDAHDGVADAARQLLAAGDYAAAVLLEAGDLGKRSPLREAFESSLTAAALACYEDDAATLRAIIVESLEGLAIDAAALDHLVACLGQDRATTRSELAKLACYVGDAGRVTLDDVLAVIDDGTTATLNELAQAICGGSARAAARALTESGGVEPIAGLRSVALLLQRIHMVQALMREGRTLPDALAALRPPVFFRAQDAFSRLVRRWTPETVADALLTVTEAEIACKQTGAPQRLIAATALLRIAGSVAADAPRRS